MASNLPKVISLKSNLLKVVEYFCDNKIDGWKIETFNGLIISWYDKQLEERDPEKCATNWCSMDSDRIRIEGNTDISKDIIKLMKWDKWIHHYIRETGKRKSWNETIQDDLF